MKISVIISVCDSREKMFRRSLDTWEKQTISKDKFELIIVYDGIENEYDTLCEEIFNRSKINFQLVKIDKNKNTIKPKTFIPALSNNIGIKCARGEIIVITGPETLQSEKNLEIALTAINRKECLYGTIFKANSESTEYLSKNWEIIKNGPFENILSIPGTKKECLSLPPHPPAYLYFMAVKRQHAIDIGGFDEKFLEGLCAEDDDFANRIKMSGIIPVFEKRIIGVHQDHSRTDKNNKTHLNRYSPEGKKLWEHNKKLLYKNLVEKNIVVNKLLGWGDEKIITYRKFYGD